MSEPIGFVSYAEGMILAELLGEDRWRVTVAGQNDPAMARSLDSQYEGAYKGPQDGYYGQLILKDLADRTGGVAVFLGQPPPARPDEIP